MTTLPSVFTPEQVAIHIGWSPRKLREFARGLGACRILGNRMVLTQQDIDAIMEASRPCPSLSLGRGVPLLRIRKCGEKRKRRGYVVRRILQVCAVLTRTMQEQIDTVTQFLTQMRSASVHDRRAA